MIYLKTWFRVATLVDEIATPYSQIQNTIQFRRSIVWHRLADTAVTRSGAIIASSAQVNRKVQQFPRYPRLKDCRFFSFWIKENLIDRRFLSRNCCKRNRSFAIDPSLTVLPCFELTNILFLIYFLTVGELSRKEKINKNLNNNCMNLLSRKINDPVG